MDALAVIWAPARSLARVAEERKLLLGFGVVALYAALSLVAAVLDVLGGVTASAFTPEDFPGVPPDLVESTSQGSGITTILSTVLSPFVGWAVVSLLMQLITRLFGGTGPLPGTFAVVGVAAVPLVISAIVRIPVTGLEAVAGSDGGAAPILDLLLFVLAVAAYAWNIALVIVGVAFARRVGYGESAGSCAISCAGIVGLIIVVGVIVVALIAVVFGADTSTATP